MTGNSIRRMHAVLIKECKQVIRDPVIIAMSVLIPCMQLIIFSFAINTNPKNLPTYIFDFDKSAASAEVVDNVLKTGYFQIIKPPLGYQQALRDLSADKVKFIVLIPPDFERQIPRPPIQIISDSSDGISSNGAVSALNALSLNKHVPEWMFHIKYNPKAITRYSVVPGLLGVILLFSLAMLTAVSIVKERERGTMEILLSTPMRPFELMLGKILPYVIMGYVQITVIVMLSIFVLGIPFRGSIMLLYCASLPYIAANVAMGMLVSALARNEMQATMGISFFMLPSMLLSGFMFPVAGMPLWAQYLSAFLPLRHYVVICRGIMLKGAGTAVVLSSIWPLLLFFVMMLLLALSRFKTTVD